MWKLLLVLLLITPSAWAGQWRAGTGEQTILGTSNAALIGFNSYNSIVQPLDNYISNKCDEYLQYASSSTLTVVSGTCVVSNSGGTIRLILLDSTNTTLTSANLDTGSLTASTTYYVYSTAATNSSTSSTYFISANMTAPSGQTYYYKIGSFSTDSNTNFSAPTIINNNFPKQNIFGTWSSKSINTIYQAATDGIVTATMNTGNNNSHLNCYTDNNSSPSTLRCSAYTASGSNGGSSNFNCNFPVRKSDYWECTNSFENSDSIYFLSSGT